VKNLNACTPPLEHGSRPSSVTRRGYYIYVTEACNLRCNYCFVSDKANNRHMRPEMASKVLEFIKSDAQSIKHIYVHFFGGEPLIRPDIIDYLSGELRAWASSRQIGLRLGITTNGTLLSEKNCEMLRRHQIGVQLSLDGSKNGNDIHRQVMGGTQNGLASAGSFDLVQIDRYIKYFGKSAPNCRMTLTVQNLAYLSTSISELHDRGFKSFSIIPNADCGNWNKATLISYENEIDRLFKYSFESHDIDINIVTNTINRLVRRRIDTNLCQVARAILGITIDGDIYPCHDFSGKYWSTPSEKSKLLIGNVESGLNNNPIRFCDLQASKTRSGNGYDCFQCWAKWVCGRGCPYMNYAASGDMLTVNSVYCDTSRINTSVALRWINIMDGYRITQDADISKMREKLAKAVLDAAGGDDLAPFGRNRDGKALLPGAGTMRKLGFELWNDNNLQPPIQSRLRHNSEHPNPVHYSPDCARDNEDLRKE